MKKGDLNFKKVSFFFSVANIPFYFFHFNGFMAVLSINDKEYRFTTYNGSKLLRIRKNKDVYKYVLKKGKYKLIIRIKPQQGQLLRSPKYGAMNNTVLESLDCECHITLYHKKKILFQQRMIKTGYEPLTDDMTLTLCVNDYRYTGLKNEGIISGEKQWESSASVRDMLVAYLAEHDPLEPVVDNNWKITGVDLQLDNPERAAYIEKVNSGELATPYNKSINLNEANNVVVNGLLYSADDAVSSGLGDTVFYRLRDLAVAFKGTTAAFDLTWNNGVVLTKGGEYTAASLAPRADGTAIDYANLTVTVDGAPVEVSALLIGGNYYVSAEGINTLLGINAVEADGVLTLTAEEAGPGSGNAG